MVEYLRQCEPLSEIRFLHDYLQLIFQECLLTINNDPEIRLANGQVIRRYSAGFCDVLAGLIGENVKTALLVENERCSIEFTGGVELVIPLTKGSAKAAEAFELSGRPVPAPYIVFNA